MKRALLTGASGFIGRQAVPLLLEQGYEVHTVSHETPEPAADAHGHQADLLDAAARRQLIHAIRPTHVLHFAWIATPGTYWTSPLNDEWLTATKDLLRLSAEAGVERFVGAGSCAEYDRNGAPCDERKTPLHPQTPYGNAKAACGTAVCDASGLSTAWGRIFHLYGPHEDRRRFVPSVILALLAGSPAECTHGKQIRDFLHVRDVASAFMALLDSTVTGPVNIASGKPVTIGAVASAIAAQMGTADLLRLGAVEQQANDPPHLTACVERLRNEVGWTPAFSLETGLADTIEWWRTHA